MKEIVFIVNSIRQARCIRRIEEFQKKGYKISVFGFDRKDDIRSFPNFPVKVIGTIVNGSNYAKRIFDIRKAIKKNVVGKFDRQTTIFYVFNLDIALAFKSLWGNRGCLYIYEVSDLTELIISNAAIRNLMIWQNKILIQKSLITVFTSEGFCDFYSTIPKEKIYVIPNKINSNCPKGEINKRNINNEKIRIGFVGIIRFETVYRFALSCSQNQNIELHLFGLLSNGDHYALEIEALSRQCDNILLHGPYNNPDDLPKIYNSIDLVLSAYPPTPGVIYAEPNKLYEAIYFRCPIIVNKDTFLAKKVQRLNIGYVIDCLDEDSIKHFLHELAASEDYIDKVNSCMSIPQIDCLNSNDDFFKKLNDIC